MHELASDLCLLALLIARMTPSDNSFSHYCQKHTVTAMYLITVPIYQANHLLFPCDIVVYAYFSSKLGLAHPIPKLAHQSPIRPIRAPFGPLKPHLAYCNLYLVHWRHCLAHCSPHFSHWSSHVANGSSQLPIGALNCPLEPIFWPIRTLS